MHMHGVPVVHVALQTVLTCVPCSELLVALCVWQTNKTHLPMQAQHAGAVLVGRHAATSRQQYQAVGVLGCGGG